MTKQYDAKITGQKAVAGGTIGVIATLITTVLMKKIAPIVGDAVSDEVVMGAVLSLVVAGLTSAYNAGKFFLSKYTGVKKEAE